MKNLDFLGNIPTFYHDRKKNVQTNFGGVFTVFLAILLSLFILAFGSDFFGRKNPKVVLATESVDEYPKNYINNKNFTFAMRLEGSQGNSIEDTRNIFFRVRHSHYKLNEEGKWIANHTFLELKRCTKEMLRQNSSFAESFDLDSLMCPVFDLSLIHI